jgi:ribosomal protein L21E
MGLCPQPSAYGKLDDWLSEHANINELIRQQLVQAQVRMKKQADKHRSEHEFTVGDMVYMKLQPYAQSTVMA